jgi:hypothetical protein
LKARRLSKLDIGYERGRKNHARMKEYPRILMITNRREN